MNFKSKILKDRVAIYFTPKQLDSFVDDLSHCIMYMGQHNQNGFPEKQYENLSEFMSTLLSINDKVK